VTNFSTIVAELYDALRAAGVDDDKARAAAGAVASKTNIDQLRRATRAEIIKWNLGTFIAIAALFFAILRSL
jgi:hypothetical protein